jgi:hypothetical protein
MENELQHLDPEEIHQACQNIQNSIMQLSPNPADVIGIAGMVLVNFVGSGVACGAIEEDVVQVILENVKTAIWETVTLIKSGESQTTQTVQ